MCRVVLIPMRQEYTAAGINLWWTRKDFSKFRQGYIIDRKRVLRQAHFDSCVGENVDPVLVVGNSPDTMASLTAKLCSVGSKVKNFVTCNYDDISEAINSGRTFSAVILDGRIDVTNGSTHEEQMVLLGHSIHAIRNVKGNTIKMTVFVDNDVMTSSPIKELISETDVESSDIMFLTPDCWDNFLGLIENAGGKEVGMG